ncbi:hypothetical protein PHYPSEUDO_011434 [Phytophthora pseudosyringae]|uniref:Uncharacterized protein n=1 Tax=Phytophthora pseudosyringae TaxID=221518 RepID=A0A8T1V8D7_9STRA|nr:hypothetical protein PHYPSEUDO_011434 [Phytophthora pseudosyringae]
MSESVADIEEAVKALDLLRELSIADILNPAGEDELHFTYTYDVVIEIVISPEDSNIETTCETEDSPAELNLPTDAEFAAAANVVLRRMSFSFGNLCVAVGADPRPHTLVRQRLCPYATLARRYATESRDTLASACNYQKDISPRRWTGALFCCIHPLNQLKSLPTQSKHSYWPSLSPAARRGGCVQHGRAYLRNLGGHPRHQRGDQHGLRRLRLDHAGRSQQKTRHGGSVGSVPQQEAAHCRQRLHGPRQTDSSCRSASRVPATTGALWPKNVDAVMVAWINCPEHLENIMGY